MLKSSEYRPGPVEFVAEKSTYVGRIVNPILPADKQLSVSTLEMLSSLLKEFTLCETPSVIPTIHRQSTANIGSYWDSPHSISCTTCFAVHCPRMPWRVTIQAPSCGDSNSVYT